MKIMQKTKMTSGQSILEFGLTLFLIIIVIFGIFNIGKLFWVKIVIQNSAREGARYLVGHPNDVDDDPVDIPDLGGFILTIDTVLQEADNSGVLLARSDVEVACTTLICTSGDTATVKVRQQISLGVLNIFGMPDVILEESAKMLIP